ncbi:COX15/CtaA family protein [Psychrosphaera haliotis]|uniref:COX15/CtaA family protein n=1 Tax=Psychrosphaera haliotis TaxID=555083 RepID=UPI0031D20E23
MLNFRYRLSILSLLLVCVVIILGAYTRLTDAGLGCPDWPGCYGFLTVPTEVEHIELAESAYPERPVEYHKARNEMVHRYFAGGLGMLVFVMFILNVMARQHLKLSGLLLVTVGFQAVLGMWTVTMNLMPLVVMGHLLGGFTTFCLILLLTLKLRTQSLNQSDILHGVPESVNVSSKLKLVIKASFLLVVLQIALGGWTAANYAAVACTDLPICEPGWQQKFDIGSALSVPTGYEDYEFGVFPYEARMTIHVLHRVGAMVVTASILMLLYLLFRQTQLRPFGIVIMAITTTQIALGISNVVFHLPLYVAVSHNFVGLLLLASLLVLWHYVSRQQKLHQQIEFNKVPSENPNNNSILMQQGA